MGFSPEHILGTEGTWQLFVALVENTISWHLALFSLAQVGENEIKARGYEIDFFDVDETGCIEADKPNTELE